MKNKWSKTWPTKPGLYWFYGYEFRHEAGEKPNFYLVEVAMSGNHIPMYVTKGHFMYASEGTQGSWRKAELPEPPKDI